MAQFKQLLDGLVVLDFWRLGLQIFNKEKSMDGVMAVVAICAVGLSCCAGYLVFVAVRAVKNRFGKRASSFELDEDVLVVDLKEYRRKNAMLTKNKNCGTMCAI